MRMKVLQEQPELVTLSVRCPKLKRNVRLKKDDVWFEGEMRYGSYDLIMQFQCKCGKNHTVSVGSLPDPCPGYDPYPDYD